MKQCRKCNKPIAPGKYDYCRICYCLYTKHTKKNGTVDYQDLVNIHTPPEVREKLNIGDIWENKVKCIECNEIIRSKNQHDYVRCKCGKAAVDGGSWYCKTSGKVETLCIPFTYKHNQEQGK